MCKRAVKSMSGGSESYSHTAEVTTGAGDNPEVAKWFLERRSERCQPPATVSVRFDLFS